MYTNVNDLVTNKAYIIEKLAISLFLFHTVAVGSFYLPSPFQL